MRAITHIAAAAVAGGVTWYLSGPSAGAGVVLMGGFMDVDHLPHFRSAGLPMRPGALLRVLRMNEAQLESGFSIRRGVPSSWFFPPLHGLEIVMALGAAGLLMGSPLLLGMAGGAVLHILMDLGSYPCGPPFFLLTWRFLNRRRVLRAWRTFRSRVRL